MVAVVAVFGPTASGKSAVAEALAARLRTGVVSCDALQVYRGLPLLTNQPSSPTALVGIRETNEEMSVAAFAALAHAAVDDLVARTGHAVVAGGTGLYLRAALADLAVPPRPADATRERIRREVESDPGAAHARLRVADPAAAATVHPNDLRRVARALELAESGASLVPADDRLWSAATRHETLIVGLEVPRDELEHRIVERTDAMFRAGVVDEVRRALAAGVSRTAEKALGLREIATLPEVQARERIVVRTRRYAAYQRKWMRRIPGLVSVDATRSPEEVVDAILEMARARQ
ncbi:miaA: tRNA dimethylallyltransferase [Gaiella occulta]|uniref:tRNA dimethylallyltransferase n=1 Tax=Gaiella occulta TaxID=1002870 RepID=A0A7M2YZE8_9ACTN|nr:tRNA (adenosine(37)-N6)-dimethylallyltransferase MiaA [Gaiella occulta]RDI75134.1 miaA: tRNA dimethylallyltransferase [Gaiella occulta]